ncbi:hypothetical protein EG829_15165, partial [bacterium]|nr:hypothetical protein [bacterium]
ITLKDDGVSPDLAAGDGIFTAQFTPAWTSDTFFFSSPAGSESIDPAPAIVSTTPSDNATGVPASSQIKVTFNEKIDPLTITPASFSLKPGVTGTVSYDAATDTATFTPSASLVPNTIYTATISTGVTDTAGIHLVQKASWSFTTAADDGTTSPISNGTFEEGPDHWVEQSDYYIISEDSAESHAGSWFAYLGGMPNLHDKLYQDIAVPAAATSASARFWYKITTEEPMTKMYDVMKLLLVNPSTGATIKTLATLSNLDDTGNEWKLSEPFDLSAYAGKTVRLLFAATTDYSNDTGFLVDDVTVTAQISPTTGSVNINGGASLTKSRLVSLSLATTGRALRLSFNNTTWGLWAPFTPTKAITLPAGDGEKTVYVQFRGGVNNFSSSYSDTITLDTTPPVNGTLAAIQLPDNQIKLDWSNFSDATSGLAGFRLVRGTALPASCGGTPIATPGAGAATYTDTGTQGVTYFYRLCGVDKAGNVGTGAAVSARAIPEVTKPTGTVVVNNDSTYANKTAVTLAITATDASKVTAYCVSNTDKCAAWTAVKATDPLSIPARAWTLATGANGPRTVTVWFRDGWGNVSDPASDTIVLDSVAPKGTVVINSGDTSTTSQTLALTLSAQDDAAGSGVEKMSYSFNNSTWSDWEDYATSKSVTFTA